MEIRRLASENDVSLLPFRLIWRGVYGVYLLWVWVFAEKVSPKSLCNQCKAAKFNFQQVMKFILDPFFQLHLKSILSFFPPNHHKTKNSRHISGPYWANWLLSRMSAEDIKEQIVRREESKKPRFVSYLWDTFDKPLAERRLLTKLDTALISFGAVGKNIWRF